MTALSLAALALGQQAVAAGVRGGKPGWGRFRGLEVDAYERSVGLGLPPDPASIGFPWCISAIYFQHEQTSAALGVAHHCPRTASVEHCYELAPDFCKLAAPQPGAVGLLLHPDGIHGHAVTCEAVNDDGSLTTVEGDTNEDGSRVGDQYARHTWTDDGSRGRLLGWWDFGLQPPAA